MPKTLVSNRITSILSHYLSVHFYTIIFDTSPEEKMKMSRNFISAKNNKSSSLIPRGKKNSNFMTVVVRFQHIILKKIKYISFRDLSPNRPFQELIEINTLLTDH